MHPPALAKANYSAIDKFLEGSLVKQSASPGLAASSSNTAIIMARSGALDFTSTEDDQTIVLYHETIGSSGPIAEPSISTLAAENYIACWKYP